MIQFDFSRNKKQKIKRVKHSKTSKRIVFFVIPPERKLTPTWQKSALPTNSAR